MPPRHQRAARTPWRRSLTFCTSCAWPQRPGAIKNHRLSSRGLDPGCGPRTAPRVGKASREDTLGDRALPGRPGCEWVGQWLRRVRPHTARMMPSADDKGLVISEMLIGRAWMLGVCAEGGRARLAMGRVGIGLAVSDWRRVMRQAGCRPALGCWPSAPVLSECPRSAATIGTVSARTNVSAPLPIAAHTGRQGARTGLSPIDRV